MMAVFNPKLKHHKLTAVVALSSKSLFEVVVLERTA